VPRLPHLARVVPAEIEDLTDGDIPMFTTRPDSRDLWSSSGERVPEFFAEPSASHVRRRLERLGPKDLEQQLWFVRASLATASGKAAATRGADPARAEGTARREELLAAARAVGDELERRALQEEGYATWIGLTQVREGRWTLAPLGLDLYDGLPGVAMFLAYLAEGTGEERYAALARGALRTLRHDLAEVRGRVSSIGAFTGLGGVIHAFTHLGALLRDDALLAEARATIDHLAPMIDRDEYLDVIGGAAGCIGALLSLHRHVGSEEALAAARRCGERLVASGKPMGRGTGWLTSIAPTIPYSGFSHGAAGIAWALLQLEAATGDERFRQPALDAIAYERTLFSAEHRNWRDLRESEGGDPASAPAGCATTWCHGAPGIGLARLATLGVLDDAAVRDEIRAAVSTVATSEFGYNHSLCHGDLGNLELLASAASALDDAALRAGVGRIARGILDDIQVAGWRCGNPLRVSSPGLMTGLAGIGYGLLRLAEPRRVPSVLLLEPPPPMSRG
jgi:type 2 lantibiotic biosynthesis protein LanM